MFGGMGGNMAGMMKKVQKLQTQMKMMQEELKKRTVDVTVGGGVVKVSVSGQKEVLSVELKPEIVDPDDIEMLQDLILSALNEALSQVDTFSEEKLGGGMGNFRMPGMF